MTLVGFYSDNGSVYIGGTDYKAQVTTFKVEGLDRDVTSKYTFSDSYLDLGRQDLAEVSIDFVEASGGIERFVLGGSDSGGKYPTVYQGDGTRSTATIKYLNFDVNNAAQQMFVFSGAYGTNISWDTGNAEDNEAMTKTLTFKCLASNFSRHWTANAAASGLLTPIP